MYYAGARLRYHYPDSPYLDSERVFLGMFCMLFGSFNASNAFQFFPDIAKAKVAAQKIFTIMDTPSKIDPLAQDSHSKDKEGKFVGSIEFRDVWFRYPSNPKQWVFKGLNLKIEEKENIAIVGESG